MPRYWVMRTDKKKITYLSRELLHGRLRQGWGYDEKLDLRRLQERRKEGLVLTHEELNAWKGNRRLLPAGDDTISGSDIILLPHLPELGRWSVVEVQDNGYDFSIDPDVGDYGHIRNVRVLNPKPIHPNSELVSARLRGTMRSQLRLWNVDHLQEDITHLLEALKQGRAVDVPATEEERLNTVNQRLRATLWAELRRNYRGQEFERPVKRLLEVVYGGAVEARGGPREHGADLLCQFTDPLGITYRVAVQVKMWEGKAHLDEALKQIREAYESYDNVAAGVILTTADEIDESTEIGRNQLQAELGIPIRVTALEETLDLFLAHLHALTADVEGPGVVITV